jgi:GT2 family glycosyltransferase
VTGDTPGPPATDVASRGPSGYDTAPMRPKVTAVILNFEMTDDTVACVRSLQKATYEPLRVLVVDNASPGDAEAGLRRALPGVEVRGTGANLGYAGGINAGFRFALEQPADYLLALNPDTEVAPGFLEPLVAAMEADPGAAIAGGTIYAHHDRTRVWYAGGRLVPWRGLAVHLHKGEVLEPAALGEPRPVTFVTGCVALHRVSLLPCVGPQDERFFLYLDDVELSARALRRGCRLVYAPRSVVYHKVLGERASRLKLYYSVRNRLLLVNTAFRGPERHAARLYFLAAIGAKLAVWSVARPAFFEAARAGLADYRRGAFHEGRGLRFRGEGRP